MSSLWNGTYTFDRPDMLKRKKENTVRVTYTTLKREGQTGDILLFSGNAIFSITEEILTNSPYSHVGMLVRDPENGDLYNWESTRDGSIQEVLTTMKGGGPRLVPLKESVLNYQREGGFVVYRKLFTPVSKETDTGGGGQKITAKEMASSLAPWMEIQTTKYYEIKLWKLPSAYTHSEIIPTPSDPSSLFCSELVVETWLKMGIPMYHRKPEYYSPQDFSEDQEKLWNIKERNQGYQLSEERLIDITQ